MKTKIQKWGNSLAVRIPQAYVKEAQLAYGTQVDMKVEQGTIIIEPRKSFDLDTLLNNVTDENLHAENENGDAAGKEIW